VPLPNGIHLNVVDEGPVDAPVLIFLHGFPESHRTWRHQIAHFSDRFRCIAPDQRGYRGSSKPHAVEAYTPDKLIGDIFLLADALGIGSFSIVGHDWGGYVGYRMLLAAPERFDGYLVCNMAHPWQTPRTTLPHFWRFLAYQPFVASIGMALQQRTPYLQRVIFGNGPKEHRVDPAAVKVYAERFRDPVVARTATDTYRTFLLHELPASARQPEKRRATAPIRALFGMRDFAIHPSLASPKTANADDYTFEPVDAGHFIIDERPDLVRARLIALAEETK
jgi:pimeloyl-ACP methyl ester carboxylesterase